MSDDQSFYEIQLNTPHLVLAALGVAVVGVALFWLGVVIGRGQSVPTGSPEWQQALPGGATAEQSQAGEEEGPLEFYEPGGEPAEQETTAGDAGETATLPPAQAEESTPDPASFQPADPVDEPRAPVAADSEATAAAEEPATNNDLPQPDRSLVSGWIVQVRSTPEENAANALQAALAMDGFPAFVVSADVNGQTYYRVRIGRYVSRSEAERVEAALLTRADIETTWVTEG